ncbi:unnamed protein product [Clonostachys solani]|uniref:Uncharacterized protein n=1 Tax=Clonostachys solani TaxID=160281 RepID=A0A9P0EF44_9HYPO|nr:unnamed protein product [Clonostachys solani]
MPLDAIDKTPPDELTYLALEDLLKSLGSKDISRRDLNLRIKYRQDPYTKALITQYGLKWVASGARRLLLADVFKHKVIAEDKFSKTIYFTDLESESEEGQASGSAGGKAARNRPQSGWPGTLQGEFASDHVKAQGIISKMWQAIRKEARVLMQDTMARFEEHTKSMEPIRLRKDVLDAREKKQLTSSQRDALASKREVVLAAGDALIKQAQQDYHELSLAAGRAMEQAVSERGIILGTLGVRISPPNVPTNAAGPHEDEVVNIRADASELLSLRTEDVENDVGGSHKEVEGAQEDEGSNVQPSESTAGVKGKHKKEEPHEKKIQMPEQKQDVEEGGIPLRRQGESRWGTQGASSVGRQVESSTRRQGESPWGRQGEPSARGKVTLMPRAEWRPMLEEIDTGYQAGREGAPPKRYASLYRKKAQVVPEEEQKLDSANGSQNGTGSHTKKNEKGPRTKKKWSPLEI